MGAGTWAWGNQFLWGYDPAKDQELKETFDTLIRGGINLMDTADSYGTGKLEGRSEKLIGQFCAGNKDADRLIIGTKFAVSASGAPPAGVQQGSIRRLRGRSTARGL